MGKINWTRALLGGLIAGVIWTVLNILINLLASKLLVSAMSSMRSAPPSIPIIALTIGVNLVMGTWAMWLYAAIRPRYGAGAKTAVTAGFAWWVISSCGDAIWGSGGFVPPSIVLYWVILALPIVIIATLAGASLYREESIKGAGPWYRHG